MSARAGIVVTGTEVLSGRVRDRNGPWLADRLAELGVDLAYLTIVGDRPADMERALAFMAAQSLDLILTSGGLGPTADDLTIEVVARFQGRALALDPELERSIARIIEPLRARYPHLDAAAIEAGTRKQAMVPVGATVLDPVGTAPGLVVPPGESAEEGRGDERGVAGERRGGGSGGEKGHGEGPGPTIVVLPGPPRELRPMWGQALTTAALRGAIAGATVYEQRTLRLFGIPESEIAETLRVAAREGVALELLEVTTCLKRGELEVVTRYEPSVAGAARAYDALEALVRKRHPDALFSTDGRTVDQQVADALRERAWRVAVAESCTGGELAARLTAPPGASEYVEGGMVVYANEAKTGLAGVDPELIERHGAVSEAVVRALAQSARARLDAEVGVGITGIAGPDGGTAEKPVGLVWLSVAGPDGAALTRSVNLPGERADVRDRATTVALHLLGRLLARESDG